MQIFCDESGGADQEHFLVTAVRTDGETAFRLVKKIKKILNIRNELKGNQLNIDQIRTVLSIMEKSPDTMAVSVICGRSEPVGGWALGAHAEYVIWGELIVESCLPLHEKGIRGVVPDGGRYKRTLIRSIESDTADALAHRTGLPLVPVSCADSAGTPGIQIADIISNAVYRSLGSFADAMECKQLIDQLQKAGQIQIRMLEMKDRQPEWLKAAISPRSL
jgi:hypothetical protein